jgi:hypothetical protein
MDIELSEGEDKFMWGLTKSGALTVRSMYLHLMKGHTRFLRKYIKTIEVQLKVRTVMWFIHRIVLLTKDNLVKAIF